MTLRVDLGSSVVEVRCSTRADGDFHVDGPRAELLACRKRFADGVWTQLDEVHGTEVRVVTSPGEHDFAVGDALVTRLSGVVLGAWVGDCAPVVLISDGGTIAAAHAGWKGALDGVLPATLAAMGGDPSSVHAYLGPCIHPCCYEFGADDLARFVDRFGPTVVGRTTWGTAALDLPRVVQLSLAEAGVVVTDIGGCTGCDERWFSHRRRGEAGRQVMTVCKRARS